MIHNLVTDQSYSIKHILDVILANQNSSYRFNQTILTSLSFCISVAVNPLDSDRLDVLAMCECLCSQSIL